MSKKKDITNLKIILLAANIEIPVDLLETQEDIVIEILKMRNAARNAIVILNQWVEED